MAIHVRMHDEVGRVLTSKLNAIPAAVDGGLASDTVIAILKRVGDAVDALYRINGTLGEIVEAISKDHQATEENAVEMLTPVAKEVEDLG